MSITQETRREGYEGSRQKAPKRWQLIYGYLQRHGPSTAEEIRDGLGYKEMNSVRPRLTEMSDKGYIAAVGKRKSSTVRNTAVWEVIPDAHLPDEGV